ncbi:MAG TPA: IS200/IS605 family transposase [Chitinophagaceae bacterium]|nr:IS200/IS605 family transposase [Chitinophagaceae bacterium]
MLLFIPFLLIVSRLNPKKNHFIGNKAPEGRYFGRNNVGILLKAQRADILCLITNSFLSYSLFQINPKKNNFIGNKAPEGRCFGRNNVGNFIKGPEGRHFMPNTYSQISIHSVFAVKGRENIIVNDWRNDLHKYISGIIKGEGATSLAVGGWKDHVHVFFGMPVTLRISDLVGKVKSSSSKWINESKFIKDKFQWQAGYGAFSYSKSQRGPVIKYIMNQEEHHKVLTFKEEYFKMLNDFEVQYNEKFLFEFYD